MNVLDFEETTPGQSVTMDLVLLNDRGRYGASPFCVHLCFTNGTPSILCYEE